MNAKNQVPAVHPPCSASLPRPSRLLAGILAGLLASAGSLLAQQNTPLDLETAVPANWTASGGGLSISSNHYKMGSQSLRWDWNAGDTLTIGNPGIASADVTDFYKGSCDFWVWNGASVPNGTLRIEFINGATPQYWFDFQTEYTGWRHAVRSYIFDMKRKTAPSSNFTSVRITAPATGSGTFYFDAMRLMGSSFQRIRDAQNKDIGVQIPGVDYTWDSPSTINSDAYATAPDIEATAPTATELTDLATLRARWLAIARGSLESNTPWMTYANDGFTGMNIVEDGNGIRGKVVGTDTSELANYDWSQNPARPPWPLVLARDYQWNTPSATASRDKLLKLLRHLIDQGHAANSNEITWGGSGGNDYQNLPIALVLMSDAYDPATKAQLWDFFKWNYQLGNYWTTAWRRDVDNITNGSFQMLGIILFLAPGDAEAVRYLKGYKRYLDRFLLPSDGSEDGVKPDGVSFHHNSHYNAYMYAWGTLTDTLYELRGTSFQINAASYQSLRKAYITMMQMSAKVAVPIDASTPGGTSIGYSGNALCGRHPFSTNIPLSYGKLDRLLQIGGTNETRTSIQTEAAPTGFLQFNYSPLGIYRRANWVTSIRAHQRYYWSSEIYSNANRYGRYQSYGALEVLYDGGITKTGGQREGWDWNHPPGTTTIELPDNKLISGGEDVRSQINFSGALAFHDGQSGLYAGNFQEKDLPNHNPTFVWKKSWFAFGDQIICLGSDIANNDAVNRTATTLFQSAISTNTATLTLDGTGISTLPYNATASGTNAHWLLDNCGTGYVIQPGTDIRITRATQTSPDQSGNGTTTTGDFAKAWLDHGTAPAGAGYEYAVFPAASPSSMSTEATKHASAATKPYQVIQRDGTAHVVRWKADGKTGYAVFAAGQLPSTTRNAGLLTTVERPCLVMAQYGSNDDARLSIVDPDLNFTLTETGHNKVDASRARTLDLTVNGRWTVVTPPSGASVVSSTATSTTLRVTTQHGNAVHLQLKVDDVPGSRAWANLNPEWTNPVSWGGALPANDTVSDIAELGAATVQPILDNAYAVKGLTTAGGTQVSGTGNLTLGASGIVATGSGNSLVLANVTLAANQIWNVGSGALSVTSAIAGAPGFRLTKSGAGTLDLSGTNTYTGGTTVNAGSGLVTVQGNQSGANGGWLIGPDSSATTTVTFATGSQINVSTGQQVRIGNVSAIGTTIQTLNANGSVDNAGSLLVGRPGFLNVNSGGTWNQGGALSVAAQGGYPASLTVKPAASFSYTGTPTIKVNGAQGSGGAAQITIEGLFTTTAGFEQTTTPSTGYGRVTLQNGGTLKLGANIPSLSTGVQFVAGTNGATIETNGYSTTLSTGLSGSGGFTKRGAGTLTLSGTGTYTGATVLEGGVLALTGSLGNTAVETKSGTTFSMGGNLGGGLTVRPGGHLAFTVAANSGSQPTRSIAGTLALDAGNVIDLTAAAPPSAGTYTLVTAAAITGVPGIVNLPSGVSGSVVINGNSLRLVINAPQQMTPPPVRNQQSTSQELLGSVLGTNSQATGTSTGGISSRMEEGNFIYTFTREDASETSGLQLMVDTGDTPGVWTRTFLIGATSATSSPGVTVIENSSAPDTIIVTIPVGDADSHFARIRITSSAQ